MISILAVERVLQAQPAVGAGLWSQLAIDMIGLQYVIQLYVIWSFGLFRFRQERHTNNRLREIYYPSSGPRLGKRRTIIKGWSLQENGLIS